METDRVSVRGGVVVLCLWLTGCAAVPAKNPYESATPLEMVQMRRERLPFPEGIRFVVSQGEFGRASHNEPGNEYSWDFDVPYDTPVVSVANGVVLDVFEPGGGGGCDRKFGDQAQNIKIQHGDGTVAQYVHIAAKVRKGDRVREGQEIATTAMNGWICAPHLHFGIYRSKDHLYDSPQRQTLPVSFDGLSDFGKASEGLRAEVPYGLQIATVKSTPATLKTYDLLKALERKFDLSPYYFTRKIQIEENVIPHSHPILTLSNWHNDAPDLLLSTFLHEELHYFVGGPNDAKTDAMIADLRKEFPKVPVGGSEGGFNEESTYLHLLVCWLELQAVKKYLGESRAHELIKGRGHYRWIYKQVLANEAKLADLVVRHGLEFSPAPEVLASHAPRVTADIRRYVETIASKRREFEKLKADPREKNWVKAKLKHMVDVDQFMRDFAHTPFRNGYNEGEKAELTRLFAPRAQRLDAENTNELKKLLKVYRWFPISSFGKETEGNAWLLVQHADHDPEFQKEILALLTPLLAKGETSPANYAYLIDRVAISASEPAKRKPQRYGTQGSCIGSGQWQAHEIEDPQNLDRRRAEVGLPPHAEYVKLFKDICH